MTLPLVTGPFQFTTATAQGLRPHQEDRLVTAWIETASPEAAGQVLAVYDGHQGAEVAQIATDLTASGFRVALSRHPAEPVRALREFLGQLNERTRPLEAGSTASIVFLPKEGRQAHIAVLGDSPVALTDSSGMLVRGPDHNVRSNILERRAAEQRGGVFINGYIEDAALPGTGLMMARALGDRNLDRILNREPEIQSVAIGSGSVGLVGTDGLLDPFENPLEQLRRLMDDIRRGAEAPALVEEALRRETGDNVTAIVWRRTVS